MNKYKTIWIILGLIFAFLPLLILGGYLLLNPTINCDKDVSPCVNAFFYMLVTFPIGTLFALTVIIFVKKYPDESIPKRDRLLKQSKKYIWTGILMGIASYVISRLPTRSLAYFILMSFLSFGYVFFLIGLAKYISAKITKTNPNHDNN